MRLWMGFFCMSFVTFTFFTSQPIRFRFIHERVLSICLPLRKRSRQSQSRSPPVGMSRETLSNTQRQLGFTIILIFLYRQGSK